MSLVRLILCSTTQNQPFERAAVNGGKQDVRGNINEDNFLNNLCICRSGGKE